MSTSKRAIALLLVSFCAALCVFFSVPSNAFAQSDNSSVRDPWSIARDAYRQQDWTTARRHTAIAVQRDPSEPRYYLSLGRIAFQQGLYEDAVWFYDIFLDYAQPNDPRFQGSYSIERARGERQSANTRRDHPEQAAREPDAQVRVREVLHARLHEGVIVGDGGSGAIATFQSLLQIGYANPDLQQLRTAIDDAARAEAARFVQGDEAVMPQLNYEQWQQQARRYELSQRFLPAAIPFDGGNAPVPTPTASAAYRSLAEGQMQYLLQNWSTACRHFRDATQAMPQLVLAHKGLLHALLAKNERDTEALQQALEDLRAAAPKDPSIALYEALLSSAKGDSSEAARALYSLLQ